MIGVTPSLGDTTVQVVDPSKLYIGRNVGSFREAAGVSPADLAAHLGFTEEEYLRREMGEIDFTIIELFRISQCVGVTLEKILTDDVNSSSKS